MSDTLELCTVQDVQSYPGMAVIAGKDETFLAACVREISARAQSFTSRVFRTGSYREVFDVEEWQRLIRLNAFGAMANQITEVRETSSSDFNDDATIVSPTAYAFNWHTGFLQRKDRAWLPGFSVVQVKWSGGLAANAEGVPNDLRQACVRQCVYWYKRRDDLGIKSKSMTEQRIDTFETGYLLPDVEQVFSHYSVLY